MSEDSQPNYRPPTIDYIERGRKLSKKNYYVKKEVKPTQMYSLVYSIDKCFVPGYASRTFGACNEKKKIMSEPTVIIKVQ